MDKKCTICNSYKNLDEFYVMETAIDGFRSQCKDCLNKKRKDTYAKKQSGYVPKYNRINIEIDPTLVGNDRLKAYSKAYRAIHKIELNAKKQAEKNAAQLEGLKHYGSKCNCCGETEPKFLTIEHKDGRDKTKKRRTGKENWLQLKRAGWPKDIEILCFNCNCAKGAFGTCPHKLNQCE